jgi:NAD(P)-dependent dehydrogenase (short-subunit alcohol dehydrogenase family)
MADTPMSQRWIVTGGSRGVGLAVARLALARGDRVAVVARNGDREVLQTELGPNALAFRADVTDATEIARVAKSVSQAWGGIDVLVNNAGLHRGGRIERLDLADWDAVIATNLSGPMHCVRAVLPYMGNGGSIVNIGAVVGFRGFPGDSPYGASKAGLAGLTQVLAVELARRQIRVNLVVPGLVVTEMTSGLSERAMQALVSKIPLRRVGTEAEVAEVICWVARSTYMTGAVVPTDGGLMCAF